MAYDDERADKQYLRILHNAHLEGEDQIAAALELLLEANVVPNSEKVHELCKTKNEVPRVTVMLPKLHDYDILLNDTTTQEFNQ